MMNEMRSDQKLVVMFFFSIPLGYPPKNHGKMKFFLKAKNIYGL